MVIKVLVGTEEYSADDQYSIQQQAGAVSSSNVIVKVLSTQDVPQTFADCTITVDDVPIFWGIIQSVESPEFAGGYEVRKYNLNISSGESIFNNRLVSEACGDMLTHEIVQILFDNYIADEGITLGQISVSTQLYENWNCSFEKLSDVLFELAEDINASFYVSPDKKFYFVTRDAFEQIDAPEKITGLKLEEENGDLRTVQIVTGASEETSTQTEGMFWALDQTVINLGYQIKSVTGISINGIPVGVGKLGVDETDITKTFLYQIGDQSVTLNSNATVQPAEGDNVVILYKGFYEIIVTNTNDSLKSSLIALNGTSGIIEQILTDETIDNFSDADQKATALLNQYGEREQTLSCSCNSLDLSDTDLYKIWNFALTDLRITGQYIIVERSLSSFGVDKMWSRIKLKNKNFFSRYGTVLNKKVKKRGADVKVYKQTVIGDTMTNSDSVVFDQGDFVFYPSDYFIDPMFTDCFYPGY